MFNRVRISHASGIAAALLLAIAPGALASAPVALDAPDNGTPPLVAYAPSDGYTYVAWSAPNNQNQGNGVDLCVYPPGGTGCEGGAPSLLTDPLFSGANALVLGGLVVLPGGEAVVIGAPAAGGQNDESA